LYNDAPLDLLKGHHAAPAPPYGDKDYGIPKRERRQNLNGGPAPQYDFCGQRGPVKREMSQGDRADVYCYFNNDARAFAIANAKKLREYLTKSTL
jgi:hypothetical protein